MCWLIKALQQWLTISDRWIWSWFIKGLKAQPPHSYYFTTPILVLKFVNKGVFFEEIQDSHFPRKMGYFGTHLHEFGEKRVNFDVQCITVNNGVHLGWKVSVLPQKGVNFGLKSQCFITKKRSFWAEKFVFCHKKRVIF